MRKKLMQDYASHLDKAKFPYQFSATGINGPTLHVALIRPAKIYFEHRTIIEIDGIKIPVANINELFEMLKLMNTRLLHAANTLIEKFGALPLGNGFTISGAWFEETAGGVWVMRDGSVTVNMGYRDIEALLGG